MTQDLHPTLWLSAMDLLLQQGLRMQLKMRLLT